MKNLSLFFLVSCATVAFGQDKDMNRKTGYSVLAGAGRAIFASTPSGPSKFPALEVRVGGIITYQLSDRFSIDGRMIFGMKAKREAGNKQGQPYTIGPPFLTVDEVASKRDHYFYELPITLKYELPHPSIGLRIGGNYRFFMPYNKDVDFLTNRREIGFIAGIFYKVSDKFNVGIDQYFGGTKLYVSHGQINGIDSELIVRNQFIQAYVEYKFHP